MRSLSLSTIVPVYSIFIALILEENLWERMGKESESVFGDLPLYLYLYQRECNHWRWWNEFHSHWGKARARIYDVCTSTNIQKNSTNIRRSLCLSASLYKRIYTSLSSPLSLPVSPSIYINKCSSLSLKSIAPSPLYSFIYSSISL